jgi:hypothetical protein
MSQQYTSAQNAELITTEGGGVQVYRQAEPTCGPRLESDIYLRVGESLYTYYRDREDRRRIGGVYGKILQQETARGVGRIHGEGKKNRARIL